MINQKKCSGCEQLKPLDEFYRNKAHKDFLTYKCKECIKAADKRYRQSERGRKTRKKYKQTDERKAQDKRYRQSEPGKNTLKRHRNKYPERLKAANAVTYAVKLGKLPRISTRKCAECGKPAQEYHHHMGYDEVNWLNVVPVCISCHKRLEKV